MRNVFHLPNPQAHGPGAHVACASGSSWLLVAGSIGMLFLPVILMIAQELMLSAIGWWEARHGN